MKRLAALLPLIMGALFLLLVSLVISCNFGTAPVIGGTEGEGLTGILIDDHGNPAAHIRVRVYPSSTTLSKIQSSLATAPHPDSVTTNAEGRFDFDHLPSGHYNVAASLKRGDTTLSVFLKGVLYEGGREDLGSNALMMAGVITLRIQLGGSNQSVDSVTCRVPGTPYATLGNDSGICVLTGLAPGTFQVEVSRPGFRTTLSNSLKVLQGVLSNGGSVELISTSAPVGRHFALNNSTIALWTFNNYATGSGNRILDEGQGGYTLSGTQRPTLVASTHGSAVPFNGTGDYFTASVDTSFTPGSRKLTIEARVYLSSYAPPSNAETSSWVAGLSNGIRLLIGSNGSLRLSGTQNIGSDVQPHSYSAAGIIPLNQWVNIAIAVDFKAAGLHYAYVNGTPVQLYRVSQPQVLPEIPLASQFVVGNSIRLDQSFQGKVDEVRVSNTLTLGPGLPLTLLSADTIFVGEPGIPLLKTTLIASQDAAIWATTTNTPISLSASNAGTGSGLSTGIYDLNTATRSLVQFTLPVGTRSADIYSAKFRVNTFEWNLKNTAANPYRIHLYQMLRSWKEGASATPQATTAGIDGVSAYDRFWGTQDGSEKWSQLFVGLNGVDAAATESATGSIPNGVIGTIEFDITALAKFWADTPSQNFGFILVGDIPPSDDLVTHYPSLNSKDAAIADSLKPRLILNGD